MFYFSNPSTSTSAPDESSTESSKVDTVTEDGPPPKQRKITEVFETKTHIKTKNEILTQKITLMLSKDLLPISFVEGKGFNHFVSYLAPNYVVPSRSTFTSRINLLYHNEKSKLIQYISTFEYVSLTTDSWSSRNNEAYTTVTLHAINNNFQYINKTLATRSSGERHTADNLRNEICYCT